MLHCPSIPGKHKEGKEYNILMSGKFTTFFVGSPCSFPSSPQSFPKIQHLQLHLPLLKDVLEVQVSNILLYK